MFSKFHWGHGITIFYTLFVITVVSVLIASFSVDRSLVADDYYAKDLAYQGQYNKAQNALNATQDKLGINIITEQEIIEITIFSVSPVKGEIHFYRPSDQSQDFTIDITSKRTTLSISKLLKGKWILKVEWTEGKTPYYQERQIYIS